MSYHTNISDALKVLRPEDKVIKIISNKYAIIRSAYEGGGFDEPHICGLYKNKIVSYCYMVNTSFKTMFNKVEGMPNTTPINWAYDTKPYYRTKINDNRKYKRHFRKINSLLNEF
jgi:hypothetical protein